MVSFHILLLASIVCIISFAAAQTTGRFIEPPELGTKSSDPRTFKVYKVGEILDVSWTTNSPEGAVFDLVINQLGSPITQIDRTPNSGKSSRLEIGVRGSGSNLTLSSRFSE